jgi:hypothetical protein
MSCKMTHSDPSHSSAPTARVSYVTFHQFLPSFVRLHQLVPERRVNSIASRAHSRQVLYQNSSLTSFIPPHAFLLHLVHHPTPAYSVHPYRYISGHQLSRYVTAIFTLVLSASRHHSTPCPEYTAGSIDINKALNSQSYCCQAARLATLRSTLEWITYYSDCLGLRYSL